MDIGEADQAIEFVKAIVSAANDMQIEVDFGWRYSGKRRNGRSLRRRPVSGLLATAVLGRCVDETALQLFLDCGNILFFRLQRQGTPPLKASLQESANPPIGVTQMIVDCWVVGSQNYRPLKPSGRALIITQAVQNPTETIDDIPVIRPQLNRPLDLISFARSKCSP